MFESLCGHEAGVNSTHDNWNATVPEGVSNFVTPFDIGGHGRNTHKVGLDIKVNGFDILIGQDHLILILWNQGSHGQESGQWGVECPIHVHGASRKGLRFWIDEMDPSGTHA